MSKIHDIIRDIFYKGCDVMFDNLQLIPGEAFTASGSVLEKIIDKVSDAVGWTVMPKGTKQYQLEAEKYLIDKIKNNPSMPDLAKAATISNARKIIKNYQNQRNIFSMALDFINDSAEPERVSHDWLAFFFDSAKNISEEDVAIIWGKLLAKEINIPGTVSKSLIHILSIIDYKDALTFQKLASFTVEISGEYYLILFTDRFNDIYKNYGLTPFDIISLEETGLIQSSYGYYSASLENDEKVMYFDSEIDLKGSTNINTGNILLTTSGVELMSVISDKKRWTDLNGF